MNAIAIDPATTTTLYAARLQSGLMKSIDGGTTWSSIGVASLPSFPTFSALVVNPLSPTTIYAGEKSKGVFKSTDGGATWAAANGGFTAGDAFGITWVERRLGAWMQTSVTSFRCRKGLLSPLAALDIRPMGYGDRGRVIM